MYSDAAVDEYNQRVHPERLRLGQLPAQRAVVHAAPQRPHGIHKRQVRELIRGRAQVEDFVHLRAREENPSPDRR